MTPTLIPSSPETPTHGGQADFYKVMARTSDDGARGISCFLVPADVAGLTALHQISGDYDLVAVVEAAHDEALDALIAEIARLRGVSAALASRLTPSASLSRAASFAT